MSGVHSAGNGVVNGNGRVHSPTPADPEADKTKQTSSRRTTSTTPASPLLSLPGSLLRLVIVDVPLTALFLLLATSVLIRHSYHAYVIPYVDAYRRSQPHKFTGFYSDFDHDMTYYNRQCDKSDITTRDAADLYIDPDTVTEERAASTMMRHGAVVVPSVLKPSTATELRTYLESRHRIQSTLPWHEKFFEEEDRLALGLGAGDHPIVTEALRQVGTNPTVRTTLEGILGSDPAIVEISTMTSMAGAGDQEIHTDSDYFGSSLLYARNFLHSYTMFISLQNTTARMGATTLCPGTHHCANADMEDVCLSNGAFEASSNGLTGPADDDGDGGGVMLQGDAMMFNQNVWHRGAANRDPHNPDTNRVMFILTFVTRNKGIAPLESDYRYQGLGTYYYQRWNTWGHTYQDLADADTVMRQPVAALRSLGIWKPRDRRWGITWMEHMARELANAEHFYERDELKVFCNYLDGLGVPKFLQGEYGRVKKKSLRNWQPFLEEMMDNVVRMLVLMNMFAVGIYFIVRGIAGLVVASSSSTSSNPPKKHWGGIIGSIISALVPILGALFVFAFAIGLILPKQSESFVEPITKYRISTELEAKLEDFFYNPRGYLVTIALAVAALNVGRILLTSARSLPGKGKVSTAALLPSFVGRFLLSHGLVVVLALGAAMHYGRTNFAKRATSKDIFTRPFAPVHESAVEHDGPTTFPERTDVLIGTRLDAEWLASFNDMFDYHPGNMRFNELVSSFAGLPSSIGIDAPRTILDLVVKRTEGVIPRFLHQSHADGYWTVMSKGDTLAAIRVALEMERDDLKKALGKTIKSILADSRFGTLRDTAMARTFTPVFAKKWEDIVFDADDADSTKKPPTSVRFNAPKQMKRPIFKPRRFAVALPRSGMALILTSKSRSNNLSTEAFKIGDKVLAYVEERWEEARIELVRDANRCVIRTLSNFIYNNHDSSMLRDFEPFAEGDRVEAHWAGNNKWFDAIISKVHPLGTYDVSFDDGSGDKGFKMQRRKLRPTTSKSVSLYFDPLTLPTYEVGDAVLAIFSGNGRLFPAEIAHVHKNGTYDVAYKDGSGDEDFSIDSAQIVPI